MKPDTSLLNRIGFLLRVVHREASHLRATDERLFHRPFTPDRVQKLEENVVEAERVDALVSRFGRLQDTLGDKLLPAYLEAVGEKRTTAMDRLDAGERLGPIPSADERFAIRKLRNKMVHEYIEDPEILASALQSGHDFVATLLHVADALESAITKRGWISP